MAAAAAGVTAREERAREWQARVSEQLADPRSGPFVASVPALLVIGGDHTAVDWCWCQPTMTMHGCGHRHGEHRETMD